MFGALLGPLLGAVGGSLVGGSMARSNAKQQQQATEHQYKHRYQWTMADLKEAGLNPMLAMNQGAVSGGGAMAMAQTPDVGANVSQGISNATQAAVAAAQKKLIASQTNQSETQAIKNMADAQLATNQAVNTAYDVERSRMENEALQKDPDAVYRSKYQGNVAREVQNVFELSRSSAQSVIDGTKRLYEDIKAAREAKRRDKGQ